MQQKKVAVIGAGCSGIVAIKECIAAGLDVVCYEQNSDIGGLWKYEVPEEGKEVHSSVYRNTVINTSKPMMSYSDFPIDETWPTFLHNRSLMTYFKSYADYHKVYPFIQFNTKVISVHPLGKSDSAGKAHDGQWEIEYCNLKGNNPSRTFKAVYDKVIVASGHHWKPFSPIFPGLKEFPGEVIHSHYYREAHPFLDKRCLVVGIGNSAVDIAVELSFHAKQVLLSTRSNAWVVPRYSVTGAPADQVLNRFFYLFPLFIRNLIFKLFLFFQWGNVARFGFTPKHEPFSAHPTINGELYARIGTGTIKIQKNVKRFLSTPGKEAAGVVEFEDGTRAEIDTVFLCTGYEVGFPFIDAENICGLKPKSNQVEMYKFIWPLNHKNIAFIGLIQPLGAIMPISELQCRWIAQVFAGRVALPSKEQMMKDVVKVKKLMADRYITSQRHTIQVDYGPYCDEIGSMIGVKPKLWNLFYKDPWLWFVVFFGCWTPHQYRLHGLDAWPRAREEIMKANSNYNYRTWMGY